MTPCPAANRDGTLHEGDGAAPHPGIPLVEGLDVDERHFPIGSGHDTVMLTADDEVDVVPELPPAVTAMEEGLMWSPEIPKLREFATHRVGSAHTPPEVTYRYATEAISFLSMSSSTNGFGLGKLYLSLPYKRTQGLYSSINLLPRPSARPHTPLLSHSPGQAPGALQRALSSLRAACWFAPLSTSKHPRITADVTASVS